MDDGYYLFFSGREQKLEERMCVCVCLCVEVAAAK